MDRRLVQAAGVMTVLFALLHAGFYWMFDWAHTLASLSDLNRGVMHLVNFHLAYCLVAFSVLSLFFSEAMLQAPLGRALTLAMVGFWLVRAVDEFVVFPQPNPVVAILCSGVGALYLAALLKSRRAAARVGAAA